MAHFIVAGKMSSLLTLVLLLTFQPSAGWSAEKGKETSPSLRLVPPGYEFPVSTEDPAVQRLFNEAMIWAYGFNHGEAERLFREAAERDPGCAMCFWGIAYVLGPNINAPMTAEAAVRAHEAVVNAKALRKKVTGRERALIEAMSTRYAAIPPGDRAALDQAYAHAMGEVAARHPEDADVAALYAEAVMDTMPWNYWTPERTPRPGTEEILHTLTATLESHPDHPGANHFLVHLVEAVRPKLGEQAADRLVSLVPAAGHLVHMSSHIYIRVGRYADGSDANLQAIAADDAFLRRSQSADFYAMMYVPHNYDFLVATAALEGRKQLTVQAALALRDFIAPHVESMPEMVTLQQFWATPYWALVRFGEWQEVLAAPEPPESMRYARAMWHHARALALARTGELESAAIEIDELERLANLPEMKEARLMGLNPAADILAIGVEEAKGELAAESRQLDRAIAHLENAVQLQDRLIYIEPPPWYHSVRLALGDVLNAVGRSADAAAVFEEDLDYFPENGWALFGLHQSLRAQGRSAEAAGVYGRFLKAWRRADTVLFSARK